MSLNWCVLDNADAVARAACQHILSLADEAIKHNGAFRLVVAGGTTPRMAYRMLAKANTDWSRWHIYIGDERCLPATDPERNSRMLAQVLTNHVPIPKKQIHLIPAELGPKKAAKRYSKLLRKQPLFDLVLLGIGEDGHTASLFPGHDHPEGVAAVAVHNAPKPPPERVSLSAETLSHCRHLLFLITGRGKHAAMTAWRKGENLPVAQIQPPELSMVLVDLDAWHG